MTIETTFDRTVPKDRLNAYLNAGWTQGTLVGKNPSDECYVQRIIRTNGPSAHVSAQFTDAYLIQRATIKRPLGAHKNLRLAEAINYDYMGNAQFEYGAMPQAMRRFQAFFPLCKTYVIEELSEEVDGRKFNMRFFGNFDSDAQLAKYVERIKAINSRKVYIEEYPRIALNLNKSARDPDLWFDLDNSVIMSFDKQFIARLPNHLTASFQFMDAGLGTHV